MQCALLQPTIKRGGTAGVLIRTRPRAKKPGDGCFYILTNSVNYSLKKLKPQAVVINFYPVRIKIWTTTAKANLLLI